MPVIYVKEQGSIIKKVNERIVIEKNKCVLADIPVHMITDLSVIGNVQISTQAIHLLMEEGVDISFFNYSGKYLGQAAAESSKNIFLRFEQFERYQDIDKRLDMARAIVFNKVNNQIMVIKNFRWEGIEYDYNSCIKEMLDILATLPGKSTSNEIMGVEGRCSAVYFKCFGQMFRGDIKFEKRTRRPPKDPINVILSLAYTLLTKEVASSLESESFELYLGFLHGIRYGRKSLALDIVEEFRQPVVDRLVVRLFNLRIMNTLDFETREDEIILTEEGFQKFCKQYEKWMNKPIDINEKRSFREVIHDQVGKLKRAIREREEYRPYQWREENVCD